MRKIQNNWEIYIVFLNKIHAHYTEKASSSKLAAINQLKQSIHNLRMRFPMGIKSIDDSHDDKLKRLQILLDEIESDLNKYAKD
jgi:hypothetical protein